MKIAHVVPLLLPTPPPKYGGIEMVVAELAQAQAEAGHSVTVFASGESTLAGRNISLIPCSPYPMMEHMPENRTWELSQINQVLRLQNRFDIIHFHYEPIAFRIRFGGHEENLLKRFSTPFICTFHNSTEVGEHQSYYRSHPELWNYPCTFLSRRHRQPLEFWNESSVIYHGLPLEKISFSEKPDNYLLFLGRITPEKGICEAIDAARQAGRRLIIAAALPPTEETFYANEVEPRLKDGNASYIGEVGFSEKIRLLGKASATLVPIRWEEPFGLVMAESLACGTPVVAFRRGSAPELIRDGVTGYLTESVEEMARAIEKIPLINRLQCRQESEQRFSLQRMTREYERTYRHAIRLMEFRRLEKRLPVRRSLLV